MTAKPACTRHRPLTLDPPPRVVDVVGSSPAMAAQPADSANESTEVVRCAVGGPPVKVIATHQCRHVLQERRLSSSLVRIPLLILRIHTDYCLYPRPFLSDSSSVTVLEQLISEVTVASHPIVIQTLVQMSRPSSRLFH